MFVFFKKLKWKLWRILLWTLFGEATRLCEVLRALMVGLKVMFSKGTGQRKHDLFTKLLGIPMVRRIKTVLGIPTKIGKSKNVKFNFILDRVRKKLKMWEANSLFFAWRFTLIKAIIQAIPTYVISSFILPKRLCKKMEGLTANF